MRLQLFIRLAFECCYEIDLVLLHLNKNHLLQIKIAMLRHTDAHFLMYFEKEDWVGDMEQQDFDTLAGFILHQLERIPRTGEKLVWRGFSFEIVDMDGHRIDKILVALE